MAQAQQKTGGMDISQQRRTWENFVTLTKWITGACIVLLILMALFLV